MCRIAITKIIVVDAIGQRASQKGRCVLDSSELEDYRVSIMRDGVEIDHVLFTYEEVEDEIRN